MRLALLGAGALVAAGLLPAVAAADSVRVRDTGGVPDATGITQAERRALDIASVRVSGHEGLGMSVSISFKGKVERLLGQGHLRRAAIVLVLHPTQGGEPLVIATEGGGDHERLRVRSSWRTVAAARHQHMVKFLLKGDGFGSIGRVEVAAVPRRGSARFDDLEVALDPSVTTPDQPECPELENLYRDITLAIAALDRRWEPLTERARSEPRRLRPVLRLVHNMRFLALSFGGDGELALNEHC